MSSIIDISRSRRVIKLKGDYDPATNTPDISDAIRGDTYTVTSTARVYGLPVTSGDSIYYDGDEWRILNSNKQTAEAQAKIVASSFAVTNTSTAIDFDTEIDSTDPNIFTLDDVNNTFTFLDTGVTEFIIEFEIEKTGGEQDITIELFQYGFGVIDSRTFNLAASETTRSFAWADMLAVEVAPSTVELRISSTGLNSTVTQFQANIYINVPEQTTGTVRLTEAAKTALNITDNVLDDAIEELASKFGTVSVLDSATETIFSLARDFTKVFLDIQGASTREHKEIICFKNASDSYDYETISYGYIIDVDISIPAGVLSVTNNSGETLTIDYRI